jgi:hypothetical protein
MILSVYSWLVGSALRYPAVVHVDSPPGDGLAVAGSGEISRRRCSWSEVVHSIPIMPSDSKAGPCQPVVPVLKSVWRPPERTPNESSMWENSRLALWGPGEVAWLGGKAI